jgi:hypothetical protein
MSFHSWLKNLRSALAPRRGQRHRGRQGSRRAATHRPNLEALEDRCLLSFSPVTSFPVGIGPQAVVTADFDNDGRLDLATMNTGGNSVSVLLGDGLGGFGAANYFATDAGPRSMTVGDFDNDGKLDLVTANAGGYTINNEWSSISVLRGDGDGTFRPRVDTVIFGQALSVAAGDFNTDGNTDLVLTIHLAFEPVEVAVALGDGQGSFPDSGGSVALLTYPRGLAVADLNADGNPDVVTANNNGNVSVLMGYGDGFLNYSDSGSSEFATGQYSPAVAVGDFTGDGIPDLVTAGLTVDVLPGLGDGTVAPPILHSGNDAGLATADFNADGKLDVVTARAGTVSVLLGRGDGTLTPPLDHAAGSLPSAVAVGDFNGDGRPDVAEADGSNAVWVLLNDGAWPDQNTPQLQLRDATVTEGNTGTTTATFTVDLSTPSTQTVTVNFATANGTAAGSDYQTASGTLTFAPGETSKSISVLVNGDRLAEPNENFVVNFSGATNANISDGQGVGTIVDDEPRISIPDFTKAEGKKGQTTLFTFTVTLSAAYDEAVTMSYATANGTAKTGDNDYIGKIGTLTFLPNEPLTKTITIEVKGDSKKEAKETFYLDLFGNSSNSLFTKNRGLGTILNDD